MAGDGQLIPANMLLHCHTESFTLLRWKSTASLLDSLVKSSCVPLGCFYMGVGHPATWFTLSLPFLWSNKLGCQQLVCWTPPLSACRSARVVIGQPRRRTLTEFTLFMAGYRHLIKWDSLVACEPLICTCLSVGQASCTLSSHF